jgi:hypothetical protein
VPGVEQRTDGAAVPRLAAGRADAPAVEVLRDGCRPLALEVAVEDLPDDLGLVLDDRHPVLGVAEPPHAALRLPLPRPVLHRGLQPPRGVVRGAAGVRDLDAEDEAVVGVGEVPPVRLAVERDGVVVGDLEQFLQVPGLPHEPVGVVGDDVPEAAIPGVFQQAVPAGPLPLAAPGRAAVVHEDVSGIDDEAAPVGDLTADALLTVDTGLVVIVRLGYAAVDRRRLTGDGGAGVAPGGPVARHVNECTNEASPGSPRPRR